MDQHVLMALDALADGDTIEVTHQRGEHHHSLILHREGEQVRAWRNVCPHQGRPLNWAPGRLLISDDGLLICPAHGAAFELKHGECVKGVCQGSSLVPLPVKVVDGQICCDQDSLPE